MKKSLILLAIPALLLGGCNKEISQEEAKKSAKAIAEHEFKIGDIESAKIESTYNSSRVGKYNGKDINESEASRMVLGINQKENFLYSFNGNSEEYVESWIYVRDNTFVTATHTKDKNGESKTKGEITTGAVAAFKRYIASDLSSLASSLSSTSYLAGLLGEGEQEAEEGLTTTMKYYSSGDGNLTIEGTSTATNYQSYLGKQTGTATAKIVYDNYLFAEFYNKSDMKVVSDDGAYDYKAVNEQSYKASIGFGVSYPDLTGYTGISIDLGF